MVTKGAKPLSEFFYIGKINFFGEHNISKNELYSKMGPIIDIVSTIETNPM